MIRLLIILFALHTFTAQAAMPPINFFVGDYTVIGKAIDSEELYRGHVRIQAQGQHIVMVRHIINQPTVTLELNIEKSLEDRQQLVAKWPGQDKSMVCLDTIDLNNEARLTCLIGRSSMTHRDKLGLEALFPNF